MATTEGYVINLSSEEEDIDDNDLEIVEFRELTKNLIDNPQGKENAGVANTSTGETSNNEYKTDENPNKVVKVLTDAQCPICFDDISDATITSCGHLFCLECIEQSLSSSSARGQLRRNNSNNASGKGLCPLCRKQVSFKDTILLKIKKTNLIDAPTDSK